MSLSAADGFLVAVTYWRMLAAVGIGGVTGLSLLPKSSCFFVKQNNQETSVMNGQINV
jgi:hypothetical protein